MSNNSSIENNETRWREHSDKSDIIAYLSAHVVFAVVGTPVNAWFLAAVLLSPKIRTRMRNKIIIGMLVANLVESAIICPSVIVRLAIHLLDAFHIFNCYVFTILENVYHIQDFIGNWSIFILVCVYAAQLMKCEPKFSPLWTKVLTTAMVISPFVFAVIFVPLTMTSFGYTYWENDGCVSSTSKLTKVYTSLDTIVPLALSSLLLVAMIVFNRCRYPYASFSTASAQLIDDRSQTDPVHPFGALIVTAVVSDFCFMLLELNPYLLMNLGTQIWVALTIIFASMMYLRLIVVPFVLLLFPDIRERIITWRPCRRSAPPVDLVVTYEKNVS